VSEPLLIDRWLTEVLASAAAGGVYADVAPEGVTEPFITFSLQDAGDVYVVGRVRLLVDATYLIKAVMAGESYVGLEDAADAIDAALHNAAAARTGGRIVWCTRERPVRYSETTGGTTYKHLGALYRVQAREE
jgi:hypothetical protein